MASSPTAFTLPRVLNRRRLLGLGGAAAALALSGCGAAATAGEAAPAADVVAAPAVPLADIGLALGNRLPTFEVEALAGGTHSLADYAGRPLFVNLWATWCGPCRIELPEMESIWTDRTYGDLAIIAISVGERRDTVEKFVAEEIPITFDVGLDPNSDSTARYNIVGFPTSYFLDRDGVIRAVNIGGMNAELLNKRILTIADPA